MRIGLIGGTGREGRGLAVRWARAGHHVLIGSRDAERARLRASELAGSVAPGTVEGGDNVWAARGAEVAVLCLPYDAHGDTLRALVGDLAGRIVVDLVVPLRPPKVAEVQLPPGEAAALEAQAILGAGAPVVAALHHVSAQLLGDPDRAIDTDVLVCADDPRARDTVLQLVADLGARAVEAGPLRNAIALESLTSVLLHINKRYRVAGAGLRITGLK